MTGISGIHKDFIKGFDTRCRRQYNPRPAARLGALREPPGRVFGRRTDGFGGWGYSMSLADISAVLAILILFPLLILGEILWNLSYTCFTPMTCIGTVIVAGCLGVLYSFIIDSIKVPRLQYIHMGSNREVCTRPTKQTFRCKYKKKE